MTLPRWCAEPRSFDTSAPERYRERLRVVPDVGTVDPPDVAERRLVEQIRAGDETVFETVYRSVYIPLWRFAVRLVHSREIADDVVHDVFLTLWARRTTLSVRTTIRAYLYGAVRQRALRYIRHQQVIDRFATARAADVAEGSAASYVRSADARTEREELTHLLRIAIHALPERQRLATLLYLDDELTPSEIAAALGVTAVAARKLLAKATSQLQKVLPDL